MKTRKTFITFILCAIFSLVGGFQAEAQIWKKIKKKAEDVATRKIEDKTTRETEKAINTILGNGKGGTNKSGAVIIQL